MSQTMIYVEQFLPVDLLNTSLWTSRLSYFYLLYWCFLIWSLLPFSKDVNLAFRFWVPLLHDAWCVCTGYSLAFSVVFCLGTAFSFFSEIIEFDLVESPVLKSCWASHSLLVVMVPMWYSWTLVWC
jgi:hypothetical protein